MAPTGERKKEKEEEEEEEEEEEDYARNLILFALAQRAKNNNTKLYVARCELMVPGVRRGGGASFSRIRV